MSAKLTLPPTNLDPRRLSMRFLRALGIRFEDGHRSMGEASFGKYQLIAELGHGGMADVFLAVQAGPVGSNFRKLSVIKRLRQNLVEEPEFVEMLIEEARIAARLNHPNVVQTNEVGQVGAQYFIAMEYLDGQPLHRIQHRTLQRTKEGKPAPLRQEHQMIIVMDALAGLHHAHDLADYDGSPLQIVHRDVTPQNIFVTYEGQVKVVDFGIAKAAGRASETRQGVVKGKVRYMAPEQAIGQSVDRRADVFSIGIMLWEVAAGRRMWKDVDDLEIVRCLVEGTHPTSPREIDPTCPEALDQICRKALAQNREERYASADEFRADLEQFLADSGKLVDARRKLAPAVIDLFQDKRAEIKGVIEKQLAALDVQASGEFRAVPMPPESVSSSLHFSQTISRDSVAPKAPLSMPSTAPPSASSTRHAVTRFATAAIIGALAAAVAIVAWRFAPHGANAQVVQTPVEQVTARLRAMPEGARIAVDDGPFRATPVELRLPKDDREHRIRVEADGHIPRTELARFNSDVALSVVLQPVPVTAAAAAPNARAGTGAAAPPAPQAAQPNARVVAAPPPQAPAAPAAPVAVEPPHEAPAPPPNEMPAKDKKKTKPDLDNGDPWSTK